MARVVVIGGDAAGATAASGLRRLLPAEHDVVMLERGQWTSYSACGIPYWVAGEVDSPHDLVARTPEKHIENGIDLRMGVEATAIDRDRQVVSTTAGDIDYDKLVIATGAEPIRPDLPGIDANGILGVQSLDDGQAVLDALAEQPQRVVVVGSGYIGLEMAEACVRHGVDTTVVEQADCPLPIIEPSLGERVADAMRAQGIELKTGVAVAGFDVTDGHVAGVRTAEGVLPADLVILGLGVAARSGLAEAAGLKLGVKNGIVVDEYMKAADHIWAAGDVVQTIERVSGQPVHIPLGTHANKQGVVVASAIAAELAGEESDITFPGVAMTAITRFCSLEISRTGLGVDAATKAGFDPVVAEIETTNVASYMPNSAPMNVLMLADRSSRTILGAQIVGAEDAALRIDAAAIALCAGMTVDQLVMVDLAYAPPFGSVWSPIQVAARTIVKKIDADRFPSDQDRGRETPESS